MEHPHLMWMGTAHTAMLDMGMGSLGHTQTLQVDLPPPTRLDEPSA